VPSTSSAARLGAFASAVADRLGLPYVEVLERTRPGLPQGEMANSIQQLANVHGAFRATGAVPATPGLLIDDTADSKWTLAVVADVLRGAGAAAVHPFVLAKA
jgi:ATP-dependent DNA helicase RecQ